VAQRQALMSHREVAKDAQDARVRFLLRERQRLRREEHRDSVSRSQTAAQAGAKRSFKWRLARKVLPVAVIMSDYQHRVRAGSAAEDDIEDEEAHARTMELVDALVATLNAGSKEDTDMTVATVVQLAPPIDVWEEAASNDSTRDAFSWRMIGEDGGQGTRALLQYYDDGKSANHSRNSLTVDSHHVE